MNELQVVQRGDTQLSAPLTANDIIGQVRLIQEVMSAVMRDKEHYGTIPGCGDKPTLLQPGAQKLLLTFRLAPEYDVTQTDQNGGHREYRVHCTLKSIGNGNFCGSGVGCCSTMEGKYRFRVAPKKLTERDVPREYWDLRAQDAKAAQAMLGGPGFSTKKDDNGMWKIAEGSNEKVEHDNPADYYNTVLKMAKKRALVDATLTATAASDIFTQDIEDMPEVVPNAAQGVQDTPPKATTQPAQSRNEAHADVARPAAPRPAATPRSVAPVEGETIADDITLTSFEERSGINKTTNKPWTLWACNFTNAAGDSLKATTFDKKIGETLDTLQGQPCRLRYKPGRQAGSFDVVMLELADALPF